MTHILLHRSTLYWSWLCFIISQIHCVFFVATICLSHQKYRSTVYLRWLYPFLPIRLWIRSVFYGGHILQILITQAQVCLPWVLKHVIIFVGCLCVASIRFSKSIPLPEILQSISVISWHLLTSYFGGHSVTCQNYSAG